MATTKLDEPQSVVIMNRQTGIAVIQTGTPLTRLNYFDGKFLRAQDLQAEQRYIRSLVELSNQAGGYGVVHGFDLMLGGDDKLTLMPGLAVDPEGRVLMLPQECIVSIQNVIDRSRESQKLSTVAAIPSASSFGPCTEVSETPSVSSAASRDWYLITIAAAEALCGEEDVYGKLCEEACITSTDRPWRVEGIVLRAHPLPLNAKLATSSAVSLDRSHLRSLIASAWYEAEDMQAGSLISKAGLESSVWCQGARRFTGNEVALAVLVREGAATLFLDKWIVRREIIDTPPKRYWQGRMGMRPWDVYLAQILQFQCQLRDAFRNMPAATADDDPCSQAQKLVAEAVDQFEALSGFYRDTSAKLSKMSANTRNLILKEMPAAKIGVEQIAEFQGRLVKASQAFKLLPQDRLLIRRGIVELPSAGYLPVIPESTVSVNQQVRRLMGEGVDLRFCIVRPDFVAHALEEAQHMERISLLEGLDNPNAKPQVDVLVPNGRIAPDRIEQGRFYDMRLNVIPQNLQALGAAALPVLNRAVDKQTFTETELRGILRSFSSAFTGTGAKAAEPDTVELRGTGRSESLAGGGLAFYFAGASQSFKIEKPAGQAASPGAGLDVTQPAGGMIVDSAPAFEVVRPGSAMEAAETRFVVSRFFNIANEFQQQQIEPEVSASLSVSMELDRDFSTLKQGESANARAECQFLLSAAAKRALTAVANNAARQMTTFARRVLVRAVFSGQLQVEGQEAQPSETQSRLTRATLAGELTIVIKTTTEQKSFNFYLSEPVEIMGSAGSSGTTINIKITEPSVLQPLVQDLEMKREWKTPTQAEAVGVIGFRTGREQAAGEAAQPVAGTTSHVVEELGTISEGTLATPMAAPGSKVTHRQAFRTWQTVNASVRESNHPAHESAIRALRNIGAALGSTRFADLAAARLFPAPPSRDSELTVLATDSWVLFHRRRSKICSEDKPAAQIETRQYALYHAPLTGNATIEALKKAPERFKPDFVQLVEFGAGIHAVISPQAQVRAGWRQDVGTEAGEIVGGLIASRGLAAAEGEKLAADRLESLVEVLRADTPLAEAPDYAVLGRVPDTLDTGQNDGIIIVATKSATTTCQDVYTVSSERELAFLQKHAGDSNLAGALKEIKAELLGAVCFREGTAQDVPETIKAAVDKWKEKYRDQSAGVSLLIYKKGDTAVETYSQQAAAIVKALGGTAQAQRAEGQAPLPNDRPAITVIAPIAVQPPAMKTMRMLVSVQRQMTPIALVSTTGAQIMASPVLTFEASGGLTGGVLPEEVSQWIQQNMVINKLTANAVTLVGQADSPDAMAQARLDAVFKALKSAGVVKSGVTPEVKTLSSIGEEATRQLLQPYFAQPSAVDDLLVLSVSSSRSRRGNN